MVFFSKSYVLLLLFAVYGVIVSMDFGGEINHQVYRFLLLVLEAYLLSFLFLSAYLNIFKKDLQYIYKIVFISIAFQSVLVVLSFLNGSIFSIMNTLAPLGQNNFDENSFRIYRGLSNSSGSGYSTTLSIGGLLALYFFSITNNKKYIICLLPIFLATAINGRTGVLLILMFIAIYSYMFSENGKFIKNFLVGLALIIVSQIAVSYFFSQNAKSNSISEWYGQAFEIFDEDKKGGQDMNSFTEGHLFFPKSTSDLLFGAGFDTDDYANGMGSDSGMIKNVFSFGLPITILFYFIFFRKIKNSDKSGSKHEKLLTIGLLLLMFIGELKEPFLMKTFLSKFLFIVVIGRNKIFKNKMIF
ncbi:hypothetical protein [Flavicella sediminum]|uniref:hypothetical protein n=1 Tax=Flavicella sediminum TaxID=2585141 RepID=UPI0011204128|nr:hypothetical protein [Flavicella sediminum]